MRPKEVMKKFLTAQAAHHSEMSKVHQTSADDYEDGCSENVFHKAAATSHLKAGETCAECAKSCDKAEFAGDLNKMEEFDFDSLVPTLVSSVAPTVPPGIRAVPRYGQRDFSAESRKTSVGTPIDAATLVQKITQVEE